MKDDNFNTKSDTSPFDSEGRATPPRQKFEELLPEMRKCDTKDEAWDVVAPLIQTTALYETHPEYMDLPPGLAGCMQSNVAEVTPLTEEEIGDAIKATWFQAMDSFIEANDEWDEKTICVKGGMCKNCAAAPAIIKRKDLMVDVQPNRWEDIKHQLMTAVREVPLKVDFDSLFSRVE